MHRGISCLPYTSPFKDHIFLNYNPIGWTITRVDVQDAFGAEAHVQFLRRDLLAFQFAQIIRRVLCLMCYCLQRPEEKWSTVTVCCLIE